ncbi:10380_t:CDS:2 [Acaulospora morrowiae]|uniref:DNA ligase n=1 Tax=Acaulospora morrowiae TaxID=94023 RepID=A0A9N8WM67_9GLOM|nr:10380_t:CDS:2 [Acaulospora morrowiae]
MKRKLISQRFPVKKKTKNVSDKKQFGLEHFFKKQSEVVAKDDVKTLTAAEEHLVLDEANLEKDGDNAQLNETSDSNEVEETIQEKPSAFHSPPKIGSVFANGEITLSGSSHSLNSGSIQVHAGTANVISVDKNILEFDPSQIEWNFHKTPYQFLTNTFSLVDKTKSRIKIVDYLTNMLRTIIYHDPENVLPTVWLLSNSLAPPYEGIELGIGSQVLMKAITSVTACNSKTLKSYYNQHGDWGDVAYMAKVSIRTLMEPKPLTIDFVYNTLRSISRLKGSGVVNQKTELVKKLLISCNGEEIRYLTRTLIQNLRIGALRTTCLIALARAFCLTRPRGMIASDERDFPLNVDVKRDSMETIKSKLRSSENLLKECYAQFPNYNGIVKCLLENPIDTLLDICHLTVGVPLRPMLGKITQDLAQVFKKSEGKLLNCEYKYDGQRAQIHMDQDGSVTIFSRHLENMTGKFPDIVQIIPRICSDNVTSFIMDGEVVAINSDGQLQNFQKLSNRTKKNVELSKISVPVCVFAFDLMYFNGQSLLKSSLRQRRDLLHDNFVKIDGRFDFVTQIESSDPEEVHAFFKNSTEFGCEGIMVKVLDDIQSSSENRQRTTLLASYEPDKRLESWLKVKKDYINGIGDSLDVVPIGAWHGNGRKARWWSPVLLAVYNPDAGTFEGVCKCMSGFSDQFYTEMKLNYSKENGNILETKKSYFDVDDAIRPDVWFEPQEVWEVKGADITISPIYRAAVGKVDYNKGLSLRFPRFVRVREDKSVVDITTSEQLAEMFFNQANERKMEKNTIIKDMSEENGESEGNDYASS